MFSLPGWEATKFENFSKKALSGDIFGSSSELPPVAASMYDSPSLFRSFRSAGFQTIRLCLFPSMYL